MHLLFAALVTAGFDLKLFDGAILISIRKFGNSVYRDTSLFGLNILRLSTKVNPFSLLAPRGHKMMLAMTD